MKNKEATCTLGHDLATVLTMDRQRTRLHFLPLYKNKAKISQIRAYTAASHQGAIQMIWLHFREQSCRPSLCTVFVFNCTLLTFCFNCIFVVYLNVLFSNYLSLFLMYNLNMHFKNSCVNTNLTVRPTVTMPMESDVCCQKRPIAQ